MCAGYEGVIASSCSDYCVMNQHVLSLLSIVLACTVHCTLRRHFDSAENVFPQRLACPQQLNTCVYCKSTHTNHYIQERISVYDVPDKCYIGETKKTRPYPKTLRMISLFMPIRQATQLTGMRSKSKSVSPDIGIETGNRSNPHQERCGDYKPCRP